MATPLINLVAAVFGAGVVVAMAVIGLALVYSSLNEESYAHEAAAEAAD